MKKESWFWPEISSCAEELGWVISTPKEICSNHQLLEMGQIIIYKVLWVFL